MVEVLPLLLPNTAFTGTASMPFGSAKSGSISPHKNGLPISAAGLAALSQLHPEEAQAAQQRK
jgi:hypothetical protein